MRAFVPALLGTLTVAACSSPPPAQTAAPAAPMPAMPVVEHKIVAAKDIVWGPVPPALPAGAQIAVLYGDPGKAAEFALRLRMPKGYGVAPHTHPTDEVVTVISGTFRMGTGPTRDLASAHPVAAGGIIVLPSGTAHYGHADTAAIVQVNGMGPFTINYVNPADDPRNKK